MQRFVAVAARGLAMPVEAPIAVVKPQAPQEPAGGSRIHDGFHGVLHIGGADEAEFPDHVRFFAFGLRPIFADELGKSFSQPGSRVMMGGDDVDVGIVERVAAELGCGAARP